MGYNAAVAPFDFARYTDEVVPAFLDLLLTGAVAPWMQPLFDDIDDWDAAQEPLPTGLDWRTHCHYLDISTLSPLAIERWTTHLPAIQTDGVERCESITCPLRMHCPLHVSQDEYTAQTLGMLLDMMIEVRCIQPPQFLGRSINLHFYEDILEPLDQPGRALRLLFSRLLSRGGVLGTRMMGPEGIQGWLTPAETQAFADDLARLDVMLADATLDEIDRLFKASQNNATNIPFAEISFSRLRATAVVAVQQGLGLLWGNDLLYRGT
ncbi:MAG: hypothetical protein SF029_23260 [bacterium]|nr:hypothetical protein [bacterium]